jgi:hypothetical protein
MAVGRARTKTTETFLHRSQSLLVGENDGGRANRGGNIESWVNLLCGQPKNKFQQEFQNFRLKKLQKSHVPFQQKKKVRMDGFYTRHQGQKNTPIAMKNIRSAQKQRIGDKHQCCCSSTLSVERYTNSDLFCKS